jgi:hypothetical protein
VLKIITWRDALIAILFALFALAFQMQRWGGYDPAIFMGSDAAIYTAVAAARANPQLFIGDTLLEHIDNYNFYKIVHIFAIQALGWLMVDYGKGMVFLLGPLVLIHLLGYYILGRVLYQNRFWALVLSLTTSVYILTPLEDDVGLIFDPLPGFAFGALLPYLLSAIIRFQDDTNKWKMIMACCAGLIYVHPVSGPAWVFGLWLFYALSNPDGLAVGQRVRRAFVLGIVAFLVALPFAAFYVGSHDTAPHDPVKVAAIREAVQARIEPSFLNPILAISAFSKWLLTNFYYTYFALLSLCFLLYDKTYRKEARVLITVVCGVVLFSTLIPCVEYLRTVNSGVPYQTAFIRPLKYIVPVVFVLSVWGLCALQESISQPIKSAFVSLVISVLIGLVFVFYVHKKDPSVVRFVHPTMHAWLHGDLLPRKTTEGLVHVEALRAVRRFTPEKSKIFVASDFVLQVRYAALRPVVYAYKDGGIFAFSNYDALLKWYEIHKRLGRTKKAGYSPAEVEQTLIPIARELDADYIFVYFGNYFEKVGTNADSRENFAAKVVTSTAFSNGHDFSVALEGKDGNSYVAASAPGPSDIDLNDLSHVWDNLHYGLYKLVK